MKGCIRLGAMLASCLAAGAGAQLLPGGLGGLPEQALRTLESTPLHGDDGAALGSASLSRLDALGVSQILDRSSLLQLRRARLRALVRDNRDVLATDEDGNPIRRGEVVAIDATPDLRRRVQAAGYRPLHDERIAELDVALTVLAIPRGKDANDAIRELRKLAPDGQFELNHVFEPAGGTLRPGGSPRTQAGAAGAVIGMIDGGVASHPALSGARIEQRGFAEGGPRASGHGTAIASLLVGKDVRFRGAAPGAPLLVADVYGGNPAAGSAVLIVQALDWLASRGASVINISLVGPPNALLARAVSALGRRGIMVVAAVGNDGPAAPPQYPASYPGVIAVTGVDARDRALPEAGRALHIDFAAPGADMAAALPGRGYAEVRGTSFAAPLVAARLAATLSVERAAAEATPGKGKIGRGILCQACRVAPKLVSEK